MMKDIDYTIRFIESKVSIDFSSVTEVIKSHSQINEVNRSKDKLCSQVKDLIRQAAGTRKEKDASDLQRRYETLLILMRNHYSKLGKEHSIREIEKHSSYSK